MGLSVLLLLGLAPAGLGAQDAREIVRHSALLDDRNERLSRQYTFIERTESRRFDSNGRFTSRESETYDVTLLEGLPYRRLIERNDRPLPPKEEAKEQAKLQKSIAERQRESPSDRKKRLQKYEERVQQGRAFLKQIPEAFDFRLVGEERIGGRDAWVIEGAPRPGYKPAAPRADLLKKVRGKLWIDKAELHWIKAEVETTDTISFGWFLARLAPRSRLVFEQTRVNDEVWLPRFVRARGSARLGLVRRIAAEIENTYSGYKKFQAESRIISTTEP